mgnify:CR=1 FL=1
MLEIIFVTDDWKTPLSYLTFIVVLRDEEVGKICHYTWAIAFAKSSIWVKNWIVKKQSYVDLGQKLKCSKTCQKRL